MNTPRQYAVGPFDRDRLPSTRAEAKALGLPRYFTGKACINGHVAERFPGGDCVECTKALSKTRDKAKKSAQMKGYISNFPHSYASSVKRSHIKHREKRLECLYAWREKNLDHERNYRRENAASLAANSKRRRAVLAGVVSTLTAQDIADLTAMQKGRCGCCAKKTKLTLDHIVPLARGGNHTRQNAQMLCLSCNSSKGAKDPVVFAQLCGRLL